MIPIPLVLKNLVLDQDLIPRDTQVFVVAYQFLDDDEYRALKLRTIAQLLGMTPSPVHAALRRLCEQGYLERGPRKKGGPVTFRIPPHLTAIDERVLLGGTSHASEPLATGDTPP